MALSHNLLAAMIDNHIHQGNELGIDLNEIPWPRVVDMNDRALREIVIGLGGKANGYVRTTRFDIVAASEVMAILALASGLADLRARLGRIIPAWTRGRQPVTAEALGAAGAMAVLMRGTLRPNLVQSLDGSPVMVHAGPFGNIAHGNSSVVADRVAIQLADYVVTESGFGSDMGFEKLIHIKYPVSGLAPAATVIVSTVRALKAHGSLEAGLANLAKHVENVRLFGIPAVVAINRFPDDEPGDIAAIQQQSLAAGALAACPSDVYANGGEGGRDLGEAVIAAAAQPSAVTPLYQPDDGIEKKLGALATQLYGGDGVDLLPAARRSLQQLEALGFGELPVCVAKTPLSLSHDASLRGAPRGFRVPIRDLRVSAGAGFVYALAGDVMTMPGLPPRPAALDIDLDESGLPRGLI